VKAGPEIANEILAQNENRLKTGRHSVLRRLENRSTEIVVNKLEIKKFTIFFNFKPTPFFN